ncbi:MAG TPA: restriction endonuclease, partial [Xanthobacteraceae bacterium]|nr:restriction endonuclease [Xanthobacteraceae bacterium]
SEQPRAWNWARSTWGLTEYVHQPRIPLINPSVRFIGKVAGNPAQIPTSTKKLVLSPGHQMEVFLEGVLRQVSAHVELGAFIAGTKEILQLSPYEFEHFVAALYARAGFKTLVTKASGDGGIDVIAVFPTDATDGLLIQAKRYSGGVGISVIRELIGARHLASADRKLYRLAVITTGRFTKASKAAELSHAAEIELYDYRALADILQSLRTTRFSDIYYLQATSAADLC